MAARSHGPQPRDYSYKLPRKMLLGALRSALSAKLRDGELKVVQAFNLSGRKTKNAKAALAKLEATRKVLVVENGENRNLTLGVRNLQGRYADAHQGSKRLSPAGPRQRAAVRSGGPQILGGTREMNIHEVIRRPLVTEKGVTQKDNDAHAVSSKWRRTPTRPQVKQAVEKLFKVKVAGSADGQHSKARCAAAARFAGYQVGLEEGLREVERRGEGARLR